MILRQFWDEVRKLASRKRNWMAFGAFLGIELIMAGLYRLPRVQDSFRLLIESRGQSFDTYFSGLTLALLTMRTTVFFIGTIFLAMVAGEIVAKEVEDGAMRMLLCRPVRRIRIVFLKYLTVTLFCIALVGFIAALALGIGLLYAGTGDFFAFGFQDHVSTFHPFREGLVRYCSVVPLLSLSLATVTSLGFMWSCFNLKPAAAIVATLTVFFADLTFRATPFFESIHTWCLTARMGAWMQVFQPQVPWPEILEDYTILIALDASFFVIGWLAFELRDLKP
jgi:ABC-2 type transport system permease protein